MESPPEIALETMHATYNRMTGQAVPFKPFERGWYEFQRAGFTCDHLTLVVNHMIALNRKSEKKISLRLDKLLDDHQRFAGYWGEADLAVREKAARARQWQPSAGEQARAAMCGHEPVPPDKEPVLPREAIAKLFGDMSKELQ